jgi:hypothetical protein
MPLWIWMKPSPSALVVKCDRFTPQLQACGLRCLFSEAG